MLPSQGKARKLYIYKIILQYLQSLPKSPPLPHYYSPDFPQLSSLISSPSFTAKCVSARYNNKNNMQSSKLISKAKQADLSINKKAASTLRKKLSVMDPTPPLDIQQSYLQFSMKSKREVMDKRGKGEEVAMKDVFMTPNNKIYNAKNAKYLQPALDASSHQEKAMKGGVPRVGEMEIRPRSSNTDKYQKSIEIHNINEVKPDSRPGSSKSSRLFRKKGSTMGNDDMKTDNDEDDSFIKVTTRQRNSAVVRQRQRIGTSLSKKTRGGLDKFQSKLDPEFFNLFAS